MPNTCLYLLAGTLMWGCTHHQEYCERILENTQTNLESGALEEAAEELARGESTCKDVVAEELAELRVQVEGAVTAQLAAEKAALEAEEAARIELEEKMPLYLEIDEAIWKSQEAHPERDAISYVAKRRGLDNEDSIVEAVMVLGEQRQMLQAVLDKSAASGVTGKVKVHGVQRTEMGPFTAILAITVIGCDPSDLSFLAQTAATKAVQNMPATVDGYRASLWHEGIRCSRTSLGTAVWNRKENSLNLR